MDMYDRAKKETPCMARALSCPCGPYAPIKYPIGDLHCAARKSSLHRIVTLTTPHNTERIRYDVFIHFAVHILIKEFPIT